MEPSSKLYSTHRVKPGGEWVGTPLNGIRFTAGESVNIHGTCKARVYKITEEQEKWVLGGTLKEPEK